MMITNKESHTVIMAWSTANPLCRWGSRYDMLLRNAYNTSMIISVLKHWPKIFELSEPQLDDHHSTIKRGVARHGTAIHTSVS